jgi:hypothetical protein
MLAYCLHSLNCLFFYKLQSRINVGVKQINHVLLQRINMQSSHGLKES